MRAQRGLQKLTRPHLPELDLIFPSIIEAKRRLSEREPRFRLTTLSLFFFYSSEAICTSGVRPGSSPCVTKGRTRSSKLSGWQKGSGAGQRGHTAGVQFPKGAPHSGHSVECSSVSVGKNKSCIVSTWSLRGEISFLTAGLIRAFDVYIS